MFGHVCDSPYPLGVVRSVKILTFASFRSNRAMPNVGERQHRKDQQSTLCPKSSF